MMPAAKAFDPIVGIDIHFVQPPGTVPPIPVPHPFIGLTIDPIDFVPVIGATVFVNGVPRATAGTGGMAIPPHIPMGGAFVKPPGNEGEVFMGSSTVVFDGEPAGVLAMPVLSCHDVGMPAPLRPRKRRRTRSLVLPTSVVLPVPMGAPVLIGGAPTISLVALGMRAGMAALGKGLGALKRSKRLGKSMKRFRKARQKAFANMKPGFVKCNVLRAEPVNVVTGDVVVEQLDFEIPWRVGLCWSRRYESRSTHVGVCGRGWQTPADARLEVSEDGTVLFYDGTPGAAVFASLTEGRELVGGARLSSSADGLQVDTRDGMSYRFGALRDPAGGFRIREIRDPFDNRLSFRWAGADLSEIADSSGAVIAVSSSAGRVRRLTLLEPASGRQHILASYDYQLDQLVRASDASGQAHTFEYERALLVRHSSAAGLTVTYRYEGAFPHARCIHTRVDGGWYDYRFAYGVDGAYTRIIDSLGHEWRVYVSPDGLVEHEVDPLGHRTSYEYDAMGRACAMIDERGGRTEWSYDELGCLVSEKLADGSQRSWSYDERGRMTAATSPVGARWALRRRPDGAIEELMLPNGGTWAFEYSSSGDAVRITDPNGRSSTVERDPQGRLKGFVDADGERVELDHDAMGHLVLARTSAEPDLLLRHDPRGRLLSVASPTGERLQLRYDEEGNLSSATDGLDHAWTMHYAGLGELAGLAAPDSTTWQRHLDGEERLVQVVDAQGRTYRLDRDACGRVVQEVSYWDGITRAERNPAGRLVRRRNAVGEIREWIRDPLDRIIQDRSAGFHNRFEYDAAGRIVVASNEQTRVELQWDAEGQLTEERVGEHAVVSAYDLVGNRVSRTTPRGGRIDFDYDAGNRLAAVKANGRPVLEIKRDRAGRIRTERLASGLRRDTAYDDAGRVRRKQTTAGRRTLEAVEYAWDTAGNLLVREENGATQRFRYAPDGRLAAYIDGHGTEHRAESLSTPARADGGFEVRAGDGVDRFDAAGRLVRRARETDRAYEWNAHDKIVASLDADGRQTSLRYDPFGRLLALTGENVDLQIRWDGLRPLQWADRGEETGEIIFCPGTWIPLLLLRGTEFGLFETEPIGLPHAVRREDGSLSWSAHYDGWGRTESVNVSGYENRLRFPGQLHLPEIGLSFSLNRFFDPITARFVSMDPLGVFAGPDLYAYAPNVWSWLDPFGADCKSAFKRWALRQIGKDLHNHPLRHLVTRSGGELRFLRPPSRKHHDLISGPYVEMGHLESNWTGAPERMALQDAWDNQMDNRTVERAHIGGSMDRSAVEIGGVPVERRTAELWESLNLIPPGTVANSPPHPGWQRP